METSSSCSFIIVITIVVIEMIISCSMNRQM